MKQVASLRRSLSLFQITLYGIGTILGAGIYVLLGEVASISGMATPLAFLVSAIIVSFSAYAYAQLSSRFPQSAGEAVYVAEGLRVNALATLVGIAIVLGGIVSSATLLNGFIGYFKFFMPLPKSLLVIVIVSLFCSLACWGVKQSVGMAVITTLIEIVGLLMVFASGSEQISSQGINWKGFAAADIGSLPIISGAFLAFYAFIGFEDMVNMAEEVKNPRRNLPIAIFLALIITTLLYATVAIVALSIVPLEQLSSSEAPLALVVEQGGLFSPGVMAFIGIVAILNGAMIQMIMASRVLYGMANNALIPKLLGYVSPRTRTPTIATILVGILVATFALWFPLVTLAQATSSLVLLVFILVNLSLAAINWRERRWFRLTIPLTGSILCATFAGLQLLN